MRTQEFLDFARERHMVHLRRQQGLPRHLWTTDPVLQAYRFTNIYRELDRTTRWFREHVRDPLRGRPEVLLATVLFRWFNRVETGEAIFLQPALGLGDELEGETSWDTLVRTGDVGPVRASILSARSPGPYVTGAFIVKTPNGMDKLDGVLWCVEQFMTLHVLHFEDCWLQSEVGCYLLRNSVDLASFYAWLLEFPYLGSFMAAQIVADLKYTDLLADAPDWHTFAASGPGSRRGLNLALGHPAERPWREPDWHHELLELRQRALPMFADEGWEPPHAQDVQNMCCEFSKHTRGSSRNRYR